MPFLAIRPVLDKSNVEVISRALTGYTPFVASSERAKFERQAERFRFFLEEFDRCAEKESQGA